MPEELVPRAKVLREFNISMRCLLNWEAAKVPGFDRPVKIGNRTYHPRSRLEAVKILGNLLPREAAE